MKHHDDDLESALAARDELVKRSTENEARAQKITHLKNERDAARAVLDSLMRSEAESLTNWARSGADGERPHADSQARERALRRLANAEEAARAVDIVLAELQSVQVELAREAGAVQERINTARARHLTQMRTHLEREIRELEDRLEASRRVSHGLYQAAHAADGRVAGLAENAIFAERNSWLGARESAIEAATASRWAQVASALPA